MSTGSSSQTTATTNPVATAALPYVQQGLGGVKDIQVLGRNAEFADGYVRHRVRLDAIDLRSGVLKQVGPRWKIGRAHV